MSSTAMNRAEKIAALEAWKERLLTTIFTLEQANAELRSRLARMEAEAYRRGQEDMREALEWALREGGWRLLYHAQTPIPAIIDASDIHNAKIRAAGGQAGEHGEGGGET